MAPIPSSPAAGCSPITAGPRPCSVPGSDCAAIYCCAARPKTTSTATCCWIIWPGPESAMWRPRAICGSCPPCWRKRPTGCAPRGGRPFIVPTGGSDAIGLWGHVAVCEELAADFAAQGIAPGHLVCATGSGGTQAGLVAGALFHGLNARVWGMAVCNDAAWFRDKIRQDLAAWSERYGVGLDPEGIPVEVIDDYIGPGYARADEAVFDTMVELARSEGRRLDPASPGKAFHGLLCEYRQGRFDDSDDLVFFPTGGLFGLFPQRDRLVFNAEG